MRSTLRCFLLCLAGGLIIPARGSDSDQADQLNKPPHSIASETDVSSLEDAAEYQPSDFINGKELGTAAFRIRSAAYIRLGAIGSPDAIAAIQRKRTRSQQILPNAPTVPSRSSTTQRDMRVLSDSHRWRRRQLPMGRSRHAYTMALIPNRIYRGLSDPKLVARSSDELVFTFVQKEPGGRNIMEGFLAPPLLRSRRRSSDPRSGASSLVTSPETLTTMG